MAQSRRSTSSQQFASAYGAAAWGYYWRMVNGWTADRAQEVAEVNRLSRCAAEFGRDDAVALSFGGLALGRVAGEVEAGVAMIDRALVLNPNLAGAWNASGFLRIFLGDYDLALEHLARATRLNPLDHLSFHTQALIALAHFLAGRYDVAWPLVERACREQPNLVSALRLAAASNACAGRPGEAREFVARALELDPDQRISNLKDRVGPYRPQDFAKYVDGLRLAGLPE
jgi:tetratricopeptide (TPR) repeat protein